ncbi:MAG: GNAT family N-acetyltransferase [Chitinophagales bacterium]
MINCIRTNSDNTDFQKLVEELDAELRIIDGEDHLFYAQFNKTDMIKHVIVAYEDKVAVGCGAVRRYSETTTEVKRMYVPKNRRGEGIASQILGELETWAKELHYEKCILETGNKQMEALHLYNKNGYRRIGNFGKYQRVENSVCFEKVL